jgi:hypothetical protein
MTEEYHVLLRLTSTGDVVAGMLGPDRIRLGDLGGAQVGEVIDLDP